MTLTKSVTKTNQIYEDRYTNMEESSPVKELLVVGSGPHSLTLLLRLLEPNPDFLSDKKRHHLAESAKKLRPRREVYRHVKQLSQGNKFNLKLKSKDKVNRKKQMNELESSIPPPLSLKTVIDSIPVVDENGKWLASWKKKFEGIGISRLRSLMNAHADPFDHRSLEYYAEAHGRGDELVTLKDLTQRDKMFRGPYQVPSTSLFHDFHDALVQSYGIKNIVQKGKASSIKPIYDTHTDEIIFEVEICNGKKEITTVRARRCVCALGPHISRSENFWETDLKNELGENYAEVSKKILRCDEIIQWLLRTNRQSEKELENSTRLLIVGGGITSVQLALKAIKASWCERVMLIHRSKKLLRHFDVENSWMGPQRGKLLEEFFSMEMNARANLLRHARKGGSIPPELFKELEGVDERNINLVYKEEVEISQVSWAEGAFHVMLDDGSTTSADFIWLATGCENTIDKYPLLDNLREHLPIDIINGLPALSSDLSWSSCRTIDGECDRKQLARKRFYCMGVLAGLQLGADALNIVGARHGAVKIAKAIRSDMNSCDVESN